MCEAQPVNDEMKCGRCGLSWDVNDPERPPCAPRVDKAAIPSRTVTNAVAAIEGAVPGIEAPTAAAPRRRKSDKAAQARGLPDELPPDAAARMAVVFDMEFWRHRNRGASWTEAQTAGMRRAYRSMLELL